MLIRNPDQTINYMMGGEWLTNIPILLYLLQTVTI